VRGDSTEVPLSRLLEKIDGNERFDDVPNLTYRMDGEIVVNQMEYVSVDTDYINIDYGFMIKQALKYGDFIAYQPFAGWYQYPITSVYSVRGCLYNCITCGGSAEAIKNNCGREGPAYRSPELMVADIKRISELFNSPVFIIGDLLQPGREYFNRFTELLGKFDIQNQIIYEFFTPPDEDAIARIARNTQNFNVEISIETHDEKIRRRFGRPYTNDELERFIEDVLYYNCGRLDIFTMIGLSGQDKDSVYDTIDYFDYLLNRFNSDKVYPFISPLAPFVDPGSIVFENPSDYGYRLFYKTLEEHKTAVENAPSWKYLLNYETKWLTRNDIVDVTYQSAMALNDIKRDFGLITTDESYHIRNRIEKALEIVYKVDEILEKTAGNEQKEGLMSMEDDLREYNIATICGEGEWKWEIGKFPYNIWGIMKEIWAGWWGV
jgi:B12-binding domain/radical SAM domain protein